MTLISDRIPKRKSPANRSGIATIEFVMCFPVLVIMVAMIYTMGTAILTQSQVTMHVRKEAWGLRTIPQNQRPFGIAEAHTSGRGTSEKTKSFRRYTNLFPQIPRRSYATNVLLTGSWDYRQIPFEKPGFSPIYPHLSVLTQMVTQGNVNTGGANVSSLSNLTNVPTN
jgi:hypothetical protein